MLANGITAIRQMDGTAELLEERREAALRIDFRAENCCYAGPMLLTPTPSRRSKAAEVDSRRRKAPTSSRGPGASTDVLRP